MNKEIKFRAWDKIQNKMQYDGYVRFSGEFYVPDYDSYTKKHLGLYMTDDCILLQFTGLVDKNGVEIYEGDIVEYFNWCYCSSYSKEKTNLTDKYGNLFCPLRGVVKWNQDCLTYEPLVNSQDDFNNNSFGYVCSNRTKSDNYPDSYFEVIGNIFENPELLTSNNNEQAEG